MIEFIRKAPFFRIFTFTATGILISRLIELPPVIAFIFALSLWLICVFLYFAITDIYRDLLWGLSFNFAIVATGLYLGLMSLPLRDIPRISANKDFYAKIENVEFNNDTKARLLVTLLKHDTTLVFGKNLKAKIDVVGSGKFSVGDVVFCEKGLRTIENRGEIGEFDYKGFSARHGIYYNARIDSSQIQTIFRIDPNQWIQFRDRIKRAMLELLDRFSFSPDEKSVLMALTTGDKSLLDSDIRSSFSTAGLMHVLAVSGLHVGIIYLVLLYLLKPLQKLRRGIIIRNLFIIMLLFAYAFFTGLSASVLRASLMFSFLIIGQTLNRKYSSMNSLFASAFLLLLFDPNMLFDVGFQLSYIAVLGIFLFYQPINSWVSSENKILTKIWSLCALSLAAQIATTPISLYYFNQFPTYFLLGNLLIVPLVGFIIQGALLFFAFSFLEPVVHVLAIIVRFLTKLMIRYASWVETLPFSVISNVFFDGVVLVLLYLIPLYAYSFFSYPHFKRFMTFSVLILFILGYQSIRKHIIAKEEAVFSTKERRPTLLFISNKRFTTVSHDSVENFDLLKRKVSNHYRMPFDHVEHTKIESNGATIRFNDSIYLFVPTMNKTSVKNLKNNIPNGVSKVFCSNGEELLVKTLNSQ